MGFVLGNCGVTLGKCHKNGDNPSLDYVQFTYFTVFKLKHQIGLVTFSLLTEKNIRKKKIILKPFITVLQLLFALFKCQNLILISQTKTFFFPNLMVLFTEECISKKSKMILTQDLILHIHISPKYFLCSQKKISCRSILTIFTY